MLTMASKDACVTGDCRPATAGDRSDQAVARTVIAAGSAPHWSYRVAGMRHFDFTDYDAYYLAERLRRLLALGSLPRGRGLIIADAYLTAFLDHAVRGAGEPLPTGPSPEFPEVR